MTKHRTTTTTADPMAQILDEPAAAPQTTPPPAPPALAAESKQTTPAAAEILEAQLPPLPLRMTHDLLPTFSVHVDLRLNRRQARALRRLANGLDARQATTANGVRITGYNHALRWLCEQLAETCGE